VIETDPECRRQQQSYSLPPQYAGLEHLLLDIDPKGLQDIILDARNLTSLAADRFDAVYCAHNLEHYCRHDVNKVLASPLLDSARFARNFEEDLWGMWHSFSAEHGR
jgi:hypothetical protein